MLFPFTRSLGKLTERMCFLGWGIGRPIRIPILGALVCLALLTEGVLILVLHFRKGHYVVAEYVNKVTNKHCPNHPWQVRFPPSLPYPSSNLAFCPCSTRYAFPPFKPIKPLIIIPLKFAESQVAPKAKLPQIIQAVISSLASPESEMSANTCVSRSWHIWGFEEVGGNEDQ